MTDQHSFSEIYPISVEKIPRLRAFSLDTTSENLQTIGGKFSYRLRKHLGGNWAFADWRLVTDLEPKEQSILSVLDDAWQNQPEIYRSLRGVELDPQWKPSAYGKARFMVNLVNANHEPMIRNLLSSSAVDMGRLEIQRIHEVRPWTIDMQPAVSISVSSRLKYKLDLQQYLSRLEDVQDIVGLWVADKNSSLKGDIHEIIGNLGSHRTRLLRVTQTPATAELLESSPDDTKVVSVGRNRYEYAATCLWPIVRPADYDRFGISAHQVNRHLRMAPSFRYGLVYKVSRIIASDGWIESEISTKSHPGIFLKAADIGFDSRVRIGNDTTVLHTKDVFYKLKKHGLYKYEDQYDKGAPIRMAIARSESVPDLNRMLDGIEQNLSNLGLDLKIIAERSFAGDSRAALEKCVDAVEASSPDIVLGVFSGRSDYYRFKSLTIGRGMPSQVVLERTLDSEYALPNIVLGITGKTGNVPYVLDQPLGFADIIVGIDVAREKKASLNGTVNVAALARIYFSDGQFVKYVIHDEPIEGETIPRNVLEAMFPANEFSGKRVVVHRDSYFRGNEEEVLREWAADIDATIYLVEVVKSGAPRLYGADRIPPSLRIVGRPVKGTALLTSTNEAIVVSTHPPGKNSTPRPLRVRSKSGLPIADALQSVLSLTLLHYGSVNPPRLPVTVHYSDKIAGLALRGVKPKALIGDRPYWL